MNKVALDDGDYTFVAENAAENSSNVQIDLEYEVKLVQSFPETGNTPYSGTPAFKPENSLQYNLSGKTEQPSTEILLYNDGTDRSNGTLAEMAEVASGIGYETFSDPRFSNNTVTTVQEQKIWLKEYIHNNALPVTWRLYGGQWTDRVNTGAGTPIVFTQTEPRPQPNRPNDTLMFIQFNLGRRTI